MSPQGVIRGKSNSTGMDLNQSNKENLSEYANQMSSRDHVSYIHNCVFLYALPTILATVRLQNVQ